MVSSVVQQEEIKRNSEVPTLGKMMEMKKRRQPLQLEAHASLPHEGKGPGKGFLNIE